MTKTTSLGRGRLLIAVYGVFALSATARALYQLFRKFDEAPVAYTLSLVSAVTYVLVTLALARQGEKWAKLAAVLVWIELAGVITVGLLSVVLPDWFKHPSVWSEFGIGYGFIPLALPIMALIWLSRREK
jgi:hypothetical protein